MSKTRYEVLKKAYEQDTQLFDRYERDCKKFVAWFRERMTVYFQCPGDKVKSLPFPVDAKFAENPINFTLDRTMALFEDASYRFRFKIDLTPDNTVMSASLVFLDFSVRRPKEGVFSVKFGKEHTIEEGNQVELDLFIEGVFKEVEKYLAARFQHFLDGKPQDLGFVISGDNRLS